MKAQIPYVPLPYCRHRRTSSGKHWRRCSDCGAVTFDVYEYDSERPQRRRSESLESQYGLRVGRDCPAIM